MSLSDWPLVLEASHGERIQLSDAFSRQGPGHLDVAGERFGTGYRVEACDGSHLFSATHVDPRIAVSRAIQQAYGGVSG
jgi:hypothetical protein